MTIGLFVLILALLLSPLWMPTFYPRTHRSRRPVAVGRKVPPPAGRHLVTQPIALPVTAAHGIPQVATWLNPPEPAALSGVPFCDLVGTYDQTHLQPRRRLVMRPIAQSQQVYGRQLRSILR